MHEVVDVVAPCLAPLWAGCAGVWTGCELSRALDAVDGHQVGARATSHFWRVGTGHGRRHVIEQTRKETHGVPLSRLSVIQCVTGFKKRGNGGTVGTANVSGGLSGGTCTPVFFWGNSNSQIGGKIG